jgi:RNA polymerase sigma-70 factor (ECF subfamily)
LLTRAARYAEARNAYEIAIGLERDPAVRGFLQRRQQALND